MQEIEVVKGCRSYKSALLLLCHVDKHVTQGVGEVVSHIINVAKQQGCDSVVINESWSVNVRIVHWLDLYKVGSNEIKFIHSELQTGDMFIDGDNNSIRSEMNYKQIGWSIFA